MPEGSLLWSLTNSKVKHLPSLLLNTTSALEARAELALNALQL
jgi:hypothetical protein